MCSAELARQPRRSLAHGAAPSASRVRSMTADERWLTAAWPFIATALPPAPAPVLDLGCGPLGGFAPALRQAGYQAIGVDPEAPSDLDYQRLPFEDYRPPHPFHA